jgi:hypothetical protein
LFKTFKEDEPDEPDNPDRPAMWFIDLSGPQYSIFNPCLKPDIYRTTYKTSKLVDSTSDLKAGAQTLVPALEFGMSKPIVEDIKNAVEEWKLTKGVAILANGKYELFETVLLGCVEEKMKELMEEVDWTARFKGRDRLKAEGSRTWTAILECIHEACERRRQVTRAHHLYVCIVICYAISINTRYVNVRYQLCPAYITSWSPSR